MKMAQLSKVLLPVFFVTLLTACDSEDNYTSNAAPNVELPSSVNLVNNTAYRVTLAPNGNQLPQIGILSVSVSGNKRLMLNDSNGTPTVSLEERDGVWFNTTDVNLPAKQLTIVSIEPISNAVVNSADIAMGDYVFHLSNDENISFSLDNSSFIKINNGECTLSGEIKDPTYPGMFNFNAIPENCSTHFAITNGILVANLDDVPASFKLVYTQNAKVQSRYVFAL